MVKALTRVLAALRKRRPAADEAADDASARKRAKLEHDDDGGVQQQQQDEAAPLSVADGLAALAQLECPVCVDTMQAPVRQCVNGHCVCNACRARVASCPLCRGPLSFCTHAALDRLARTLTLRCVHDQCPARIKVPDRESHLLQCQFNVVPCPLQPCAWSGPFPALGGHCLDRHPLRTRAVALDANVCFSQAPASDKVDDEEVPSLMHFDDVALLVDAEVFLLEVHADELPGRVAVLGRQLSAGRLRPPPHHCSLAVRSRAKPQSVVSASVPALAQEETLVPAVEAGRCLVLDWDAVKQLGAAGGGGGGGGVSLECRVTLPPAAAAQGWLSWLADKFWPR